MRCGEITPLARPVSGPATRRTLARPWAGPAGRCGRSTAARGAPEAPAPTARSSDAGTRPSPIPFAISPVPGGRCIPVRGAPPAARCRATPRALRSAAVPPGADRLLPGKPQILPGRHGASFGKLRFPFDYLQSYGAAAVRTGKMFLQILNPRSSPGTRSKP